MALATESTTGVEWLASHRAESLRKLADFIEAHPDLAGSANEIVELTVWVKDDPDRFVELVSQLGADVEKDRSTVFCSARREFGAGVRLDVTARSNEIPERILLAERRYEAETGGL